MNDIEDFGYRLLFAIMPFAYVAIMVGAVLLMTILLIGLIFS